MSARCSMFHVPCSMFYAPRSTFRVQCSFPSSRIRFSCLSVRSVSWNSSPFYWTELQFGASDGPTSPNPVRALRDLQGSRTDRKDNINNTTSWSSCSRAPTRWQRLSNWDETRETKTRQRLPRLWRKHDTWLQELASKHQFLEREPVGPCHSPHT